MVTVTVLDDEGLAWSQSLQKGMSSPNGPTVPTVRTSLQVLRHIILLVSRSEVVQYAERARTCSVYSVVTRAYGNQPVLPVL